MKLREAINLRKAYNKLHFKIYRSSKYATQAGGQKLILNRYDQTPQFERLRQMLPYAHQSASLHGLNQLIDDLIEFQEDERYRPTAGKLAGVGIPIAGQTAVAVGTLGALGVSKARKIEKRDLPLMHKLNIEATKAGAEVFKSQSPLIPGFAFRRPKGKGFFATRAKEQIRTLTGEVDVPRKGVAISPEVRPKLKPGALAHEIGHIKQPKWMTHPLSRGLGQHGTPLAALYAGITSDEDRAKAAAIAGSAAAVPMLTSEVDASIRGARLLQKHGVKGIRRLSPGLGLASYGAVAAMPAAAYAAKKAFGGDRPKTEELSALFDDLLEFEKKQKPIPVVIRQSRRDPEERLRDRLSILASMTKTAAGIGALGATAYGVHEIKRHSKGLLKGTKGAMESMRQAGESIQNLDRKTDEAAESVRKLGEFFESTKPGGQREHLRPAVKKGLWITNWLSKKTFGKSGAVAKALNAKLDALIEFGIMSPGQIEELFGKGLGGFTRKGINPAISKPLGIGSSVASGGEAPINVAMKKISQYGTTSTIASPTSVPGAGVAGEAPVNRLWGSIKQRFTPSPKPVATVAQAKSQTSTSQAPVTVGLLKKINPYILGGVAAGAGVGAGVAAGSLMNRPDERRYTTGMSSKDDAIEFEDPRPR